MTGEIMRLNRLKIAKVREQNMFGDTLLIEDWIPEPFKRTAAKIIDVLEKKPILSYNTQTEYDRKLILLYWSFYDGYGEAMREGVFKDWFIHHATNPAVIERSRRFLMDDRDGEPYLYLKEHVRREAKQSSERIKDQVSGRSRQ